MVVITWRNGSNYAPANPTNAGDGFVAIDWGCLLSVVGVYLPPSLSLNDYENRLVDVAACIHRRFPRPVIITGDFNAKSVMWGSSRTDRRGAVVELWANQLGLCFTNTGSSSTCVRPQGWSIIDITWSTLNAVSLIKDWRVVTDTETLSDHKYIEMRVFAMRPEQLRCRKERERCYLRWSTSRLDEDRLLAAVIT